MPRNVQRPERQKGSERQKERSPPPALNDDDLSLVTFGAAIKLKEPPMVHI